MIQVSLESMGAIVERMKAAGMEGDAMLVWAMVEEVAEARASSIHIANMTGRQTEILREISSKLGPGVAALNQVRADYS
jgi:hypothetical protein